MENIKDGNVVQLKSGGPKMTVKWIDGSDAVCLWFNGDQDKTSSFPVSSLTKMSD